jgi:hypothetical protein
MRSPIRAAVPLALVAGLVAVSPAAADAKAPKAHASGGDATALIYPSIVQVRVDRTERAVRRATKAMENGNPTKAATTLKTVRRQMSSAWRGAKYVIRTTPPPPPPEAAWVRAHVSGGAPVGPTFASPADTGVLVLNVQHEVAAATVQLIDGAHGTGLNALSTTLNFTLDRRDQALKDIVALAPPAPPPADDARVHAHVSGGAPVVDTFDTLMPNYAPLLQDEIQTIEGTKSDATDLTAGGRRLLNDAENQIGKTVGFVNTTWPPVPAEA